MNQSMRDLHVILAARVQALSAQLDSVTDPAVAQKILAEMQEFNHRVTLVGQQLFRKQSKALDKKVAAVRAATGDVDQAIGKIAETKAALATVGSFLALVDEAIDLAKSLSMA